MKNLQLIPIEEYSQETGLTRKTLERYIKSSKIPSTKVNGKRMIIVDAKHDGANTLTLDKLCKEKIIEIKMKAAQKGTDYIKQLLAEVDKFNVQFNVILPGVSYKTLWAIANQKRSIEKKIRKDSLTIKNEFLAKHLPFILHKAKPVFLLNAKKNLKYTIYLLQEMCRLGLNDTTVDTKYDANNTEPNCDKYKDILQIPYGTLRRQLDKSLQADGSKEFHLAYNHKNLHHKKRAKVIGAFTDTDLGKNQFRCMDYIIGDDRKTDVFKVRVYNKLRDCYEEKTCYTWFWIEGRTQRILAYVIKTTEITTDDLKVSFLRALAVVGRPRIAIMLDNGALGKSNEFQAFAFRLGIDIEYSKPYHSDDKATIERCFGYMKEEFDVFFNNFTGSNHKIEGRHTGLSMSPAKPNYDFEQYCECFDTYLKNIYETRPRQRTIDGKKFNISIRDYFEQECQGYKPDYVDAKQMRLSYMVEAAPKKFFNFLNFLGEQYTPEDFMGLAFNGHKYKIAYNPNDLTYIDLYAAESFEDKTVQPHKKYLVNQYVMTCKCTRSVPKGERRGKIGKYNKQAEKKLKEYTKLRNDVRQLENPALMHALDNQYDENGNKIEKFDVLKSAEKVITKLITDSVPEDKIDEILKSKTGVEVRPGAENKPPRFNMDEFENDLNNLEL